MPEEKTEICVKCETPKKPHVSLYLQIGEKAITKYCCFACYESFTKSAQGKILMMTIGGKMGIMESEIKGGNGRN